MIGMILDKPVDARLYGSVSTAVIAAMSGADIVRVHDVAESVDAVAIVNAMKQAKSE
jgi:dihydropteroate synthase